MKAQRSKKWHESLFGRRSWKKGTKGLQLHSEETKRKISEKLKGNQFWLGKHHTEETRRKMSLAQKGNKGNGWRGGITSEYRNIRHSVEYKLWRESVFKRDNYTCIWCGQVRGNINADHIKPFILYPELRFAIDNGRTLCVSCHKKTDTYGNKLKHELLKKYKNQLL